MSSLKLSDVLPINPAYRALLRNFKIRLLNQYKLAEFVHFFSSAMMYMLRNVPGAYLVFGWRRTCDHSLDQEIFAGWSLDSEPTWFNKVQGRLDEPQLSVVRRLNMRAYDIHLNMRMLWLMSPGTSSTVVRSDGPGPLLDLVIMSESIQNSRTRSSHDEESRIASQIIMVHLCQTNKFDTSNSFPTSHDIASQTVKTHSMSWFYELQSTIIGSSRGLTRAYDGDDMETWALSRRKASSLPEWVYAKGRADRRIKQPMCRCLRRLQLRFLQWSQRNQLAMHREPFPFVSYESLNNNTCYESQLTDYTSRQQQYCAVARRGSMRVKRRRFLY